MSRRDGAGNGNLRGLSPKNFVPVRDLTAARWQSNARQGKELVRYHQKQAGIWSAGIDSLGGLTATQNEREASSIAR